MVRQEHLRRFRRAGGLPGTQARRNRARHPGAGGRRGRLAGEHAPRLGCRQPRPGRAEAGRRGLPSRAIAYQCPDPGMGRRAAYGRQGGRGTSRQGQGIGRRRSGRHERRIGRLRQSDRAGHGANGHAGWRGQASGNRRHRQPGAGRGRPGAGKRGERPFRRAAVAARPDRSWPVDYLVRAWRRHARRAGRTAGAGVPGAQGHRRRPRGLRCRDWRGAGQNGGFCPFPPHP